MRKEKSALLALVLMLTLIISPHVAYGSEEESESQGPYFLIEASSPSEEGFPLKETSVTTNINGIIAETYVTQTYANEGKTPINAKYVFPIYNGATVHGMKMTVGDNVVTAEIKEKEEAIEEYEQAKSEGKSASLLQQKTSDVFTMDVSNIMPGDIVSIEIHYTQLIVSTEGTYQFVFPTVVGPRYVNPFRDIDDDNWALIPYCKNEDKLSSKYNINVSISAGVPISYLKCKTHDTNIKWNEDGSAQINLQNPKDFAGNRDYILEYKLTGKTFAPGLMLHTDETENFFMLMVQPPEQYELSDIPPREYIFVLDVSGSMFGYPIDTAKELINDLVANLKETDLFNLILFSGASIEMAPQSVPATKENIQRATRLINRQNGGGGTELAPALEKAVAYERDENISRSVVVITDGYIFGESEIFDIINENVDTTSFFSFGIGSSINRSLIDGIAKAGLGEAFVVTDSEDAEATSKRFRKYIQNPVLTDIDITFEGFDTYDVEPAKIPTLFAERPIIVFGKWQGEPTGTIEITGKTGNGNYASKINISEVEALEYNNVIPYLWARTKVERLTGYGASNYEEDEIRREVTEIGLKYSMMTPYTSFVAVVDKVRNTDMKATDIDQPLPLPENVSHFAIGGYTVGSEPKGIILIAAAIIIAGALYGRKRKAKRGFAKHGFSGNS